MNPSNIMPSESVQSFKSHFGVFRDSQDSSLSQFGNIFHSNLTSDECLRLIVDKPDIGALVATPNGNLRVLHHLHHDRSDAITQASDQIWGLVGGGSKAIPVILPSEEQLFEQLSFRSPKLIDLVKCRTKSDLSKIPPPPDTEEGDAVASLRRTIVIPAFLVEALMDAPSEAPGTFIICIQNAIRKHVVKESVPKKNQKGLVSQLLLNFRFVFQFCWYAAQSHSSLISNGITTDPAQSPNLLRWSDGISRAVLSPVTATGPTCGVSDGTMRLLNKSVSDLTTVISDAMVAEKTEQYLNSVVNRVVGFVAGNSSKNETKVNHEQFYTEDEIRSQVRICLAKLRTDETYIEYDLHPKHYDSIRNDSNKTTTGRFYDFVAKSLVLSKVEKSLKKRITNAAFVREEIARFEAAETGTRNTKHALNGNIQQEGKSRKRKLSTNGTDQIGWRMEIAAELKKDFLMEKKRVLDSLDRPYKKLFGQIAFCRWKRGPYRPVVILGPYSVPLQLRDTWMKMWNMANGDSKKMWHYVYWFGSPISVAYTRTKVNELIMYEEALKMGLHKLDEKIQAKIDTEKKLTAVEEQVVKGYNVLEIELSKDPSERQPESFRETHETVLDRSVNLEDIETNTGDNDSIAESAASEQENTYELESAHYCGEEEVSNDESDGNDSDFRGRRY